MAFSMMLTIGVCVWGGRWADAYWSVETPWFTLLGGTLGTGIAIWTVIQKASK